MNLNIKSGIEFNEAIIDACKSRLEAIFITSICTILGIIPVTLQTLPGYHLAQPSYLV
jgi:multidrug efflux pump subunit AcrB